MARQQQVIVWSQPANTVLAASSNSGDLDVGGSTYLAVDINITAVTGAGTITLTVNRKGADGVYYPIYTSAALAAVAKTSMSIGPGLPQNAVIGDTIRVDYAIGGTSVTCSISVIGRRQDGFA